MKRDTKIIIGICLLFIFGTIILFWRENKTPDYSELNTVSSEDESKSSNVQKKGQDTSDDATDECAVYISGEVNNPGLYRYSGNERVYDAIKASGGFTKNAHKDSINLARALEDGEQIVVLSKKQYKKQKEEEKSVVKSSSEVSDEKININTATVNELMTLQGVGQSKADAIIRYREENGLFSSTEDLMKIPGIKEGIFNKIKNNIITN